VTADEGYNCHGLSVGMNERNLFQSAARQRQALIETRARLQTVRLEVAATLRESARLTAMARQTLAELKQTRERVRAKALVADSRRPGFVPRPVSAAPDAETDRLRLHDVYASTRDATAMAELMASYDGFARSLAGRFRRRDRDDDLYQVARIGLLQAIQRFDPSLGRPFLVFARATILGELKRHIRDRTWTMRVPRSLKEDYLAVIRAVDEITMQQGDSPSMQDLAAHCGISVERVVEALELRSNQWALSLDGLSGEDGEVLDLTPGQDEAGFRLFEDRQLLARLLARLPERDRRIIELRFLADKTQMQIAEEIGVSQMCVSRVLARTLGRLRVWARSAVA
jgi:RNA polymerase sigma-B factor